MTSKEKLTIKDLEKILLDNFVNEDGDLDISGLDFGDFNGDVNISQMKVKGYLYQDSQEVGGNLFQFNQEVGGHLFQPYQRVGGHLFQYNQKVDGNLYQSEQKVGGHLFQYNQKVGGHLLQSHQEEGERKRKKKRRNNMDFKARLRDETYETIDKLNKLNEFMATKTFYNLSRVEKDLLYEQVRTLNILVQILGKRCEFYEIKLNLKEKE